MARDARDVVERSEDLDRLVRQPHLLVRLARSAVGAVSNGAQPPPGTDLALVVQERVRTAGEK
jgi:hypothetical protein